ncbi:MAG: hypothetical protein GWP04_01520 [Gammaproteobacteria bacterium]|nr:hypothetical protein [Gammaproteobacteria bacterium]
MQELLSAYLPAAASVISFVFASMVLRRWLDRRQPYMLLWGIGFLMYGMGGAMEAIFGFVGWSPLVFRLWYLFGAILVAAWLGQGTVYLLVHRRFGRVKLADILMVILALGSLYALVKVAGAQLDPSQMLEGELSGHAIVSPGVRVLTPFFNLYGVIMLVGGAIYSAYYFWRTRAAANRMVGNIFIAIGAMMPAFGGAAQRFGIPVALYVGEFLGAILMFIGYLYSSRSQTSRVM